MKRLVISLVVAVVTLAFLIMAINADSETDLPYTHSSTKAICTKENLCQDYEIFCKNKHIISMSPITGAVVQFSPGWEDPRSEEIRNKMC